MNTSVNFSNPFVLIFLCGTVATFLINHFLEFIDFRARAKNGGLFVMDASKRSGHSNAYFSGFGKTKRLFIMIPMEFVVTFLLYKMAHIPELYYAFGFLDDITAENIANVQFIGIFLATMLWGAVSEIITPVSNIFSRKQEYQADAFGAKACGSADPLKTGLIKLNSENLSELIPPKLYVFWNYSHPTLVERIEKLSPLPEA